ncbi:MAG TPA: hypothetical protein VF733_02020 [Candidatus Saccharimonadales bacterium]
MILELVRWWYVTGWLQAVQRIGAWVMNVEHAFSLSLLVTTLFAPWRRIITPAGRGLDAKVHAMLDNLVSRCIGFVIRLTVLLAASVSMLGAFLAGVLLAVIWPLLPAAVIFFAVKGITG